VRFRATEPTDLPTLYEIFIEAMRRVYAPHGYEAPVPALEVFVKQQTHVLATGVGVIAEEEGPLGFASSWTRGDDWFLASLFVRPEVQGGGIGSALLDAVWESGAERRRTISDAIQPVSNALYVRRGLVPVTPILLFSGRAANVRPPAELSQGEFDEAALRAVDRAAYGFDRAVDHAYWERLAPRREWFRGDTAVAYAYFAYGHIGPLAAIDADAAAAALAATLAGADGEVRFRVPGTSRTLVQGAIDAGLRLSPTPQLLLLSANALPPKALALAGATLF
jgi:GNAT superfamily N-acetyltransferase